MTSVVLAAAPLAIVLGALYWVLSFYKVQAKVTAEIWKRTASRLESVPARSR